MLWNLRKVLEIPVFFHIYAIDFSKGSLYNRRSLLLNIENEQITFYKMV